MLRFLAHLLFPSLCRAYMWFVSWTSRVVIKGREFIDDPDTLKKPKIFAFWHEFQMVLIWPSRKIRPYALISQSGDGELVAKTIEGIGYRTVRGSSSKGGVKALVTMIRKLKEGNSVAITPDGPRGPRHKAQPGILSLAEKGGVPIVPVSCEIKHKKVLRSWDAFIIPYPFNKISIVFGEPFFLDEEENDELSLKKVEDSLGNTYLRAKEQFDSELF